MPCHDKIVVRAQKFLVGGNLFLSENLHFVELNVKFYGFKTAHVFDLGFVGAPPKMVVMV